MSAQLSDFARSLTVETAFTVLGRRQNAEGRGQGRRRAADRRQPVRQHGVRAGGRRSRRSRTISRTTARRPGCPSFARRPRISSERSSASRLRRRTSSSGPGAKMFEQFFCEAFLDPGDGVLVFSPHFPTYLPEHRAARSARGPRAAAAGERVPARPRRRRAVLREDPSPRGDLPQLAAQPDRRRRHRGGPDGTSPTSSAAATSPSSATSRTATWSGRARITRC